MMLMSRRRRTSGRMMMNEYSYKRQKEQADQRMINREATREICTVAMQSAHEVK